MKKTITILLTFLSFGFTNAQVTVTTLAGSTQGFSDGTGSAAKFYYPQGVATDAAGNVYVADANNNKIRKITPAGEVSTLAGSTQGYTDGSGDTAQFHAPISVATDAADNLYVGDVHNNIIRKITPTGEVSTLAGSTAGFADGTGAAQFDQPWGVSTDTAGNVYVADINNNKIRKITPEGVVSTLAGSIQGYADGNGASAKFFLPRGVATDTAGNVYVADTSISKIRKISSAGVVSTLAGSTQGFADGTGAAAQFNQPYGLTTDTAGNVYVADTFNNKIRKITPAGEVTTLAGSTAGFADGIGATAKFYFPACVAIDAAGNVYVADAHNHKIRKITQTLGVSQNEAASKITIFPNPVCDVLQIQTPNNTTITKATILAINGQVVLEQTQNTNTINVEKLAQGVYILEVYSGEEKYTSKFVKE